MNMLRNPFGERNGEIVVIDDLSENEKGLNCGCVCPLCCGEFEARLGNVRVHHFAHSKGGCDEEKAYLTGLYKLFKQYLDRQNFIYLPEIILYCCLGYTETINESNFYQYVSIGYRSNSNKEIQFSPKIKFTADKSEIVYKDDKPVAMICFKGNRQIAVVIQHPQIGCNIHFVSPYGDIPTLKLDLIDIKDDEIKDTAAIYNMFGDSELYSWLSNKTIISKLDEINRINLEMYQANIAKRKAEQEKRLNSIYATAVSSFQSDSLCDVKNALRIFTSIIDWKDSREIIEKCECKIEDIKYKEELKQEEEKRLNEERIVAEKAAEEERILKAKEKKKQADAKRQEEQDRQHLPLIMVMRDYYEKHNLGEPDCSLAGRFDFIQRFSTPKYTLGKMEAELCIDNGMPPVDHWKQLWVNCKKCGKLFIAATVEDGTISDEYTDICPDCEGK